MVMVWNERTHRNLALNVDVALLVVFLTNGFLLLFNPSEMAAPAEPYRFQPPGWAIGLVWTLLFAGLGLARWLAIEDSGRPNKTVDWVFLLLLFCAAYPLYTLGLRSLMMGLAGNAVTCMFVLWAANRIRQRSLTAALLVSSVAALVTFVSSLLIVEQLRGRSF